MVAEKKERQTTLDSPHPLLKERQRQERAELILDVVALAKKEVRLCKRNRRRHS